MARSIFLALFVLSACGTAPTREYVRSAPEPRQEEVVQRMERLDSPKEIIVFPALGLEVTLPEGWLYTTDTRREEELPVDLIMSDESRGTSITLMTYWDTPLREWKLDHVSGFHHWRLRTNGQNEVSKDEAFVDERAYFLRFAARVHSDRGTLVFWIVTMELHAVPEPVIVIYGIAPEREEAYMREKVDEVISAIAPYEGEDS